MDERKVDVSIIIVEYNTKELLKKCLSSIYENTKDVEFEVIVSDNGSSDGSCQMVKKDFPEAILIENNKNLGFGKANNIAKKISKGKYVFFLNSDTILMNNAAKIFFDFWENSEEKEKIGAIGTWLLNDQGKVIHSYGHFSFFKKNANELFKTWFVNAVLSILYALHIPTAKLRKLKEKNFFEARENRTISVDFITGADLFMKNDENAFYDEDFFLYFEDMEMQFRLEKKNLKRLIINGPEIIHLCGGSVGEDFSIKRKASFSRIQFEYSRLMWIQKNYGKKSVEANFIKFQIVCCWLNPFLLSKTKEHIKKIGRL